MSILVTTARRRFRVVSTSYSADSCSSSSLYHSKRNSHRHWIDSAPCKQCASLHCNHHSLAACASRDRRQSTTSSLPSSFCSLSTHRTHCISRTYSTLSSLPSHTSSSASSSSSSSSSNPNLISTSSTLLMIRPYSTSSNPGPSSSSNSNSSPSSKPTQPHTHAQNHPHDHKHDHEHDHDRDDDHGHGIFHTHPHDHHEGAEQLIQAIQSGRLDRGTRITLLGLGSNVALTISKGVAGLWMNSASLLAEAGHSLSDLLGDFVTLATWRISRRPPSDTFPWGYNKFETCGTLAVSIILIGGALGIGLHSYHLLLQTLVPYLESLPPESTLSSLAQYLPSSVPSPLLELFHSHGAGEAHSHAQGHSHSYDHGLGLDAANTLSHGTAESHAAGALLNPHAAWFALASVIMKEWLYQLTSKVAKEEHSPVLKANALHHRADALTSLVALTSILGSSFGGYTWLDPLGGIAVSFFILQQGLSLSRIAIMELLDVGIDRKTQLAIEGVVDSLVDGQTLLGCRNVRGVKSGGQTMLDLTISVSADMTVRDSHSVEQAVRNAVMKARKEVREVKIHVHGEEEASSGSGGKPVEKSGSKDNGGIILNDFGRDGC